MNYLLKNNRRRGELYRPFVILLSILGLAGIFYFLAPRSANQGIFVLARPIWGVGDFFSGKFNKLFPIFKEKDDLYNENLSLKRQLEDARLELLALDSYKIENADLKEMVGRNTDINLVLANVLKKPGSTYYDSLVIDVGLNEGVKIGDSVIYKEFLIGDLVEVYSNYSKVELSSSPNKSYDVRVGDTGVDAVAIGRGGGNFLIKLPKEIDVEKKDLVKVVGGHAKFFGEVEDIEKTESSSFQFILFTLPVNLNTLETVEVVKK